jgi:hypothetical protein
VTATGRPDPSQAAAEERVGRAIQAVLVAVAVAAAVGAALGDAGRALEWTAVVVITAIPLARVGWLAVRWSRQRDWRFVALAVLLLVLVALGPVTALLQR